MRFFFVLLATVLSTVGLQAQTADPRIAATRRPLSEVELRQMPALNNKTLLAAEMARRGPGVAPRFAETMEVDLTPAQSGTWEMLPDGRAVWRLRIASPGAHSLNLGFTSFVMPEGGTLILYSPDYQHILGPFTPADNEEHEQLWTPILPADELVVEVQLPAQRRQDLQLRLKTVNHDFLGFSTVMSGSCNLDVICGSEDGWAIVDLYRDIIQSVGVYGFNGNTFCTGFLINNGRQDCTPFFMTANHCGVNVGNASSVVVYWNYFNSICRQPNSGASGGPGDGVLTDFNSGSLFRAAYAPSDMTLLELDDPVSSTADAFFAGWTATDQTVNDTVICVHHPSTDEKRISFEFAGVYRGSWGQGSTPVPTGNHLVVADWDIGTTEGGSSGSPLFNRHKQVIGQLHGGAAACGNNAYDSYGWFHTSWTGGGTPQTRLRDWLDPDNLGLMELGGRAQLLCSFFVSADVTSQTLCAPTSAVFQLTAGETFAGPVTLSISGLPLMLSATFGNTTVQPGGATTLTIGNTNMVAAGTYSFNVNATDGTNTSSTPLQLVINNGLPAAVIPETPATDAIDLGLTIGLSWQTLPSAATYDWELALDPLFEQVVGQGSGLTANSVNTPFLETSTTYYWRVRARNVCGTGAWSQVFNFTTGALSCAALPATDLPVPIGSSGTVTVTSTLAINVPGNISSVRLLGLNVNHSWVGDLSATLTSPSGTVIDLFDRPGAAGAGFGCGGDNLQVDFDDNATNTAADFEGACANAPAISGAYQPIDAFSAFAGEPAAGNWVLTILDNADGDGGAINGWSLDFCATLPSSISLAASATELVLCPNASGEVTLVVGTGFAGNVTLSGSGLPMGATLTFSDNPVAPGDNATLTVGGIATPGNYPLTLTANAGADNATLNLLVRVLAPAPAPLLLSPANNATGVGVVAPLSWSAAAGATGYVVTVSTAVNMSNPIITQTVAAAVTSFMPAGLAFNTTYFWTVATQSACGNSVSTVRQFTTTPDLQLNLVSANTSVCPTAEATYLIALADGFGNNPTVSFTTQPAANFSASSSFDAASRTLTVTLDQLFNGMPGNYVVTITVANGNLSNSLNTILQILSAPSLPNLQTPAPNAVLNDANIGFSWSAAAGATSYRLEMARDAAFTDIVASTTTTGTSAGLVAPEEGLLYWRVTATNTCGDAVTSARIFTFQLVGVHELGGARVEVLPNPTAGPLYLRLTGNLIEPIQAELLGINGQQLRRQLIPPTAGEHLLELGGLPAGTYLLRLRSGQATVTERIVKQ